MELLRGLRHRYSAVTLSEWQETIKAGDWNRFVRSLLKTHYDPSYARSTASRPLTDILALTATTLDDDDIHRLAGKLAELDPR